MKHLERLVGDMAFRDGLREYLDAHRYANASWRDLIATLDARTDEDLETWSQVWVGETGRPTVELVLESEGDFVTNLTLRQSDPAGRGRLWNQRLDLLLGYADGARQLIPIQLQETSATVREAVGRPIPNFVLANGDGVGYGLMALDSRSLDYLLRDLPSIDDAIKAPPVFLDTD